MIAFTRTPAQLAVTKLQPQNGDLKELLSTYEVGAKEGPAIIPATFAACPEKCHNKRGGYDCGGGRLHRLDVNVTSVTMLGIDIDKGSDVYANIEKPRAKGLTSFWWNTHSHTPELPKLRIVIPFDKPLPIKHPLQWKNFAWPKLMAALGFEGYDETCSNTSRVYYLPRKPVAGGVHNAGHFIGKPLDWESILGTIPDVFRKPSTVEIPAGLPLSPRVQAAIQDVVDSYPPAELSEHNGNNRAFALGALLCNDWALSFEQAWKFVLDWNASCLPPWGEDELEQLKVTVENGAKYAGDEFGKARLRHDPFGVAMALVAAYRQLPQDEQNHAAQDALADAARKLVGGFFKYQPSATQDRERLETELIGDLKWGKRTLALPKVKYIPPMEGRPTNAERVTEVNKAFAFYVDKNGTSRVYSVNARRESVFQEEETNLMRAMKEQLERGSDETVTPNDVQQAVATWKMECPSLPSDPEPFAFADGPITPTTPLVFKRFDWAPTEGPYPAWEEFLSRLSDSDAFMAWVWGALESQNKGRQYMWLWGPQGEDGKSVVLHTLSDVFGPASAALSTASTKDQRFLAATLWGKRFVVYPDCKNAKFGMSEIVRSLTSSVDEVPVEFKGKTAFFATLTAKLAIASNLEPQLTNQNADTSRCLLIKVSQSKVTDDPTWGDRLRAETPAFLDACRTKYAALCPNNGKITFSALSESLLRHATGAFEADHASVFERCFVLDPKSTLPGSDFRDALIDAKLFDGQKQHDFKLWLKHTHNVSARPDGKRVGYPGIALAPYTPR